MACLLMTRPRADAERFVADLPASLSATLDPVYAPLIDIQPVAGPIAFDDARTLIFSSKNGVAAAAALTDRRDLPCVCVGEATAGAARAAGWSATCAGPDARTLLATLAGARPAAPLLHLRGAHASVDIAAELMRAGIAARTQVIYDQQLLQPTEAARAALAGSDPVIAPLFSPRTARQFANTCAGRAPLFLAAISDAAAEPLQSMGFRALEVARHPDADAMIDAVAVLAERAIRVEGNPGAQ